MTKHEEARLLRIEAVARKIQAAKLEQAERTRKLHELASEARRTGLPMSHRIDKTPRVWDLGDLVDELCEALESR